MKVNNYDSEWLNCICLGAVGLSAFAYTLSTKPYNLNFLGLHKSFVSSFSWFVGKFQNLPSHNG